MKAKKSLQLDDIVGKKDSASFCKKLMEVLQILDKAQPAGRCDVYVGPFSEDDPREKKAISLLEGFGLVVSKREGERLFLRPTSKGLAVAKRLKQ